MGEQLVHAERERTEDALNVRRTRRQEVAPPPRCERSQGCVHRRLCCLPGEAILELYHDVDLG